MTRPSRAISFGPSACTVGGRLLRRNSVPRTGCGLSTYSGSRVAAERVQREELLARSGLKSRLKTGPYHDFKSQICVSFLEQAGGPKYISDGRRFMATSWLTHLGLSQDRRPSEVYPQRNLPNHPAYLRANG